MASRASTARSWSPPTESTTECLHHKDEQGGGDAFVGMIMQKKDKLR